MWILVLKFFAWLGRGVFTKALVGTLAVVAMWVFHAVVMLFPKLAMTIMKSIVTTFYTPPPEWAGFLSGYIERMTGMKISIEDIAKQGAGIGARSFMESLGSKFLNPMLGLIMPTPAEVEKNPLGGANRFMATNLQFQLSAWLLHVIGDINSLGMFKSLKDLPNAISWSYGIGWLSWLVMGPPFRAGIAAPMEKLFNRIYTQSLLTQSQAAALTRHGLMTHKDYLNACLDIGLHPQKAAWLYEAGERELADAWLKRLSDMGWIEQKDIVVELTRRGFSPERAGILARLLKDTRKIDLIEKIISSAEDLYKDRTLDRTKLEGYYNKIGYKPEEIELSIALLELQRSRRRFLTPAQVVQLWLNKKLGRVECKSYLVNDLQYTAEDAELYMSLKSPTA